MWRRAFAWLVVLALLLAQGLPVLSARHVLADADVDCSPALASGHSSSQFEPVLPPVADEHCAVCHWLRAINGARLAPRLVAFRANEISAALSLLKSPVYVLHLTADRPARAPPARS